MRQGLHTKVARAWPRKWVRLGDKATLTFAEPVSQAYHARVSLSATGFYATPKISYDVKTLTGRPFFYFCYSVAISEVIIDSLTGESRLLRVDILHDVGRSLNTAIDMGAAHRCRRAHLAEPLEV